MYVAIGRSSFDVPCAGQNTRAAFDRVSQGRGYRADGLPIHRAGCLRPDIRRLVRRASADDQKARTTADPAMSRSRRQDDAVAGRYVDLATAGSTDQKPGLATCDAQHLMRAGVVMLVGKNPVAPTILPTVQNALRMPWRDRPGLQWPDSKAPPVIRGCSEPSRLPRTEWFRCACRRGPIPRHPLPTGRGFLPRVRPLRTQRHHPGVRLPTPAPEARSRRSFQLPDRPHPRQRCEGVWPRHRV